jgi:hypothetical protein
MLAGLGWTEGQGLGASNQGITAPVNKNASYTGLGVQKPDDVCKQLLQTICPTAPDVV